MFIDLPHPIQQQVLYYLEANNFPAAKTLRDQYVFYFNADGKSEQTSEE